MAKRVKRLLKQNNLPVTNSKLTMTQRLPRLLMPISRQCWLTTKNVRVMLPIQSTRTQTNPLECNLGSKEGKMANSTSILSSSFSHNTLLRSSAKTLNEQLKVENYPHSVIFASYFHTSSIMEKARNMTRIKKRKVAVKNKKIKEDRLRRNPPPLPYKVQLMLEAKGLGGPPKPLREKDNGVFVADNVYIISDCAWKRWTLEDALKEIRLNNHPSLGYSKPNSLVRAKFEFDLRAAKKDKYIDVFSKMIPIIHAYDRGVPDRNVMAFVPNEEMETVALEAGASKAGGEDLITGIAKGRIDVADVDYFVAHEDISSSINILAGLLRDKLPRIHDGTIGSDLPLIIATFSRGMYVNVEKVKPTLGVADEPDYGFCDATFGRLDMEDAKLESNLTAMLLKLSENRVKRKDKDDTSFITRCILKADGSNGKGEEFSIIHNLVSDKRVDEQKQVLLDGRKTIAEKVLKIRERNTALT